MANRPAIGARDQIALASKRVGRGLGQAQNTGNGAEMMLRVCNSRSVIAVVELKFLPRGQPNYEKDIRTLVSLARHRKKVSLRYGRYRGASRKVVEFGMSDSVLIVWAGIHAEEREEPERLYSSRFPSLAGCFLELHAVTKRGADAEVYARE